jgi:dTDP-4-amino-4,6-dideoxygalactose transaminase
MTTLQTLENTSKPTSIVPFNDLALQWRQIAADVRRDIEEVFETSAFCLGPQVEAFEHEAAAYLDVPHAIGVSSGTAALHLAMVAAGVGPGDEVLVPSHTFIATVWCVLYVGATPVLCDVDPSTGTLDAADAERRITARTRAIVPVHLYGQPAEMDQIASLASRHNLVLIEDAAQSIGARWNGRATGSLGAFGCYSFYPGKNLGAAGEGGMIVTADAKAAARLRALRAHAQSERYVHNELGFNYRMDGLQGAVLRHKLRRLDAWTDQRRQLAAFYESELQGLPLERPAIRHQDHVWHLYVVRTPQRDRLRAFLEKAGIQTGLHYPVPCHRQPCLAHLPVDRGSFPHADRWASESLSLPLFSGMTQMQQRRVIEGIREFFAQER